jgi:hypothetical protein
MLGHRIAFKSKTAMPSVRIPADTVEIPAPPTVGDDPVVVNIILAMATASVAHARQRLNKVPVSDDRTRAQRALDSALELLQGVGGDNAKERE